MSNDRFVLPPPKLASLALGGNLGEGESGPGAAGGTGGGEGAGGRERGFVSRAGHKLEAALVAFKMDIAGRVCADLGANVGGFTDCLLRYGAAKVFAVDTAYGVLAWTLRKDARVVVKDRTNALHIRLPEMVSLVTIDVGWTRQERALPAAAKLLAVTAEGAGDVLTLIKPHYESELAKIQRGVLTPEQSEEVLWGVIDHIAAAGEAMAGPGARWELKGIVQSPLEGQKGNVEYVAWLRRVVGKSGDGTQGENPAVK